MSNESQWAYWMSALAGKPNRDLIQRGNPQSGYYRDRAKRAVAIWRDNQGALKWAVTSGYNPKHPDELDELFGFVCNSPITHAEWLHVKETGNFSDHVADPEEPAAGIGDNSGNRPLSEIIQEQIEEKQREFKAWMEQIGGKLVSEAHATKAANFKDVFLGLEKKADEARKAEKAPLDEQVKEVQARWLPVIDAATTAKKYITRLWEAWGLAELERKREEERLRREEIARQQREAERMAAERGDEAPPPPLELSAPPEKARVSAGTRGKVSMRTRKVIVVNDAKALLSFFAGFDNPPPELMDVASKLAKKMLEGGSSVPGAELRTEDYAV
jgi:hypothetical protein